METTHEKVIAWAKSKGLTSPNNIPRQYAKLHEEVSELGAELLEVVHQGKATDAAKMELGDVLVVCAILAHQLGTDAEACLSMAYEKIKDRKGRTVNGMFVKESDLPPELPELEATQPEAITPSNLLSNLNRLGPWTQRTLAEVALQHYAPEYFDADGDCSGLALTELMAKLKFSRWTDVIRKYHAEVGYNAEQLYVCDE